MSKNLYPPKISVILVCYRQQDVIGRAIESVMTQKEYLYELFISDDCSPDNTWEIIEEYRKKYPNKIRSYRHPVNHGAYENFQSTYDKVDGDIIFYLSGDDELGDTLLQSTLDFLSPRCLDYAKEKFCVLTKYKIVYNDRKEVMNNTNSKILDHNNYFQLKLRGIINNRALGESKAVFNMRKHVYIDRKENAKIPSTLQEGVFDILPFYHAQNIFFLDIIGNIYHAGIGISTRLTKHRTEYLEGVIEFCENCPEYFPEMNDSDKNWLNFHREKSSYLLKPRFMKYLQYFKAFAVLMKDPLHQYFAKRELVTLFRAFTYLFSHKE